MGKKRQRIQRNARNMTKLQKYFTEGLHENTQSKGWIILFLLGF